MRLQAVERMQASGGPHAAGKEAMTTFARIAIGIVIYTAGVIVGHWQARTSEIGAPEKQRAAGLYAEPSRAAGASIPDGCAPSAIRYVDRNGATLTVTFANGGWHAAVKP
jgi:hypothetical protein